MHIIQYLVYTPHIILCICVCILLNIILCHENVIIVKRKIFNKLFVSCLNISSNFSLNTNLK